jgi:hypothetical protein
MHESYCIGNDLRKYIQVATGRAGVLPAPCADETMATRKTWITCKNTDCSVLCAGVCKIVLIGTGRADNSCHPQVTMGNRKDEGRVTVDCSVQLSMQYTPQPRARLAQYTAQSRVRLVQYILA